MFLGGLEGEGHVSPSWMGLDFDLYNLHSKGRRNVQKCDEYK